MGRFQCVIQADSAADRSRAELTERLVGLHHSHFPADQSEVAFLPVAAGMMFTEGQQSTSSVITCVVPTSGTTRDFRETYMRGVCDLWTDVTGCTDHEIVVAFSETESDQPQEA